MWKLLLGFLTGPLTSISNDLKEAYTAKLQAANDSEKVAADERINLLEARKSVILAAQSDPVERLVRVAWAFIFILYTGKCVIWDKVFAYWTHGVTDPLSNDLQQLMWIVVGGYFVDTVVRRFKK